MPTADDDLTRAESDAFSAGGELMRAAVEALLLRADDWAESDIERHLLASLIDAVRSMPVVVPPDTPEDWAALIAIVERHLIHVSARRR